MSSAKSMSFKRNPTAVSLTTDIWPVRSPVHGELLLARILYLHCKNAILESHSMDRVFEHGGTTFEWDEAKALENRRKHGISFEEAVTVFDDPLLVLQDASRN